MARLERSALVRRLKSVREELGFSAAQMASRLGVARSRYGNWEVADPAKPSFPAEEAMMELCEILPGLTLDYLYRGKADGMPFRLALSLIARESDPDQELHRAALAIATRKAEPAPLCAKTTDGTLGKSLVDGPEAPISVPLRGAAGLPHPHPKTK